MTAHDDNDHAHLLDVACRAADAGADVLRRWFRDRDLEIREKSQHDFVTRADRESESAILDVILGAFPDHAILAEESGERVGGDAEAPEWVIDPLDGTSNFLQGLPVFCISIACRQHGRTLAGVVLDPLRDDRFTATLGGGAFHNGQPMRVSNRPGLSGAFLATGYPFRSKAALDAYLDAFRALFFEARGIRRCGAAALDLAHTAAGVYDGFFELRLSPWDLAAGVLLIREAGGVATDLDGTDDDTRIFASGHILAGGPATHQGLVQTFRDLGLDGASIDRLEAASHDSSR